MSESKKTLIIAGVLFFVICLGWYMILYRPKMQGIKAIKEDTENFLLKLQSLRVTDEQIASLEVQIEKLEKEIAAIQAKILPKSELPKILHQIEKKGEHYGLKFYSIIPEYDSLINVHNEEKGASDLLKLTVHFKLQGYYKNFGNFIDSLDDLPFMVSQGNISLYYNEGIYPKLEIMMDLVLYLRETLNINSNT